MKFHVSFGEFRATTVIGETRDSKSFIWALAELIGIDASDIDIIDIEFEQDVDRSPLAWFITIIFTFRGISGINFPTLKVIFSAEF